MDPELAVERNLAVRRRVLQLNPMVTNEQNLGKEAERGRVGTDIRLSTLVGIVANAEANPTIVGECPIPEECLWKRPENVFFGNNWLHL